MARRDGIELYDSNARRISSLLSIQTTILDDVADDIRREARRAAMPYRKSIGDSYVDHFKVKTDRYTGKGRHKQYPVYDRLVVNDHYAAHIVELGIGQDVIHFSDGRDQKVTELQRGHFFLTGAAAKVVGAKKSRRPRPALRKADWGKKEARAAINRGTVFRHNVLRKDK
nr:MAG TPA: hypothetical protein [Caudoviricetes sp.]